MNRLVKLVTASPLLYATSLFALNPIQGFYIGLFGEVSHGPSGDEIYFEEDASIFHGNVDYSPISGGAGFMLGYKYSHFRAEGEFLYNRISTGPLTVGTCTLQSPDVSTPTGVCTPGEYDGFQEKALGYSGSSSAAYGLFNVYWDFFSENNGSEMVPYVGVGMGIGSIKNGSSIVNTISDYSHGQTHTSSGVAYQGILGVSYYMDDFTWCSLDYRYIATNKKPDVNQNIQNQLTAKTYTLNTFNLTINGAFDKGGQ